MRFSCHFVFGILVGIAIFAGGTSLWNRWANADSPTPAPPAASDSAELAKLNDEDQADRRPKDGQAIDWAVVGPRDRQREGRVKALYEAGALHTGKDYYRAAMVLQHASKPDDYLLAHELCVLGLPKGERAARWLACASEDRYLMSIGQPQRFGTQFRATGANGPMKLYEVGAGVTDALRRELGVPTLAEARQREAIMNEKILEKVKEPELAKELGRRADLDQKVHEVEIRFMGEHKLVRPVVSTKLKPDVAAAFKALEDKANSVDRDNLTWMKTVVAKYGWPGKSLVGKHGAFAAFLLIQHADRDPAFQEACLKKMQAAPPGEVEPVSLAYLTDRVLVAKGKKQKYGTQGRWVNGKMVAPLIEDEATVDERRKAIGLGPLRAYLKALKGAYENAEGLEPIKTHPKKPSQTVLPDAAAG
jgi:hypothetical protein